MVALVALFLVLAVILMLVLIEKNTGGREGGVGCVSGAVIVVLLALAASQYNAADSDRLGSQFRQLLTVGLGAAGAVGIGYLVYAIVANHAWQAPERQARRRAEREHDKVVKSQWAAGIIPNIDPRQVSTKREVRAAYWVDALSLLDDEAYQAWLENNHEEIHRSLGPENWRELSKRREAKRLTP